MPTDPQSPPSAPPPDEATILRARVAALEEEAAKRKRLGRPPRRATTADARLVARVLALGWTKVGLLKALGYSERSGVFSRCNGAAPGDKARAKPIPLPEKARARLREMLGERGAAEEST